MTAQLYYTTITTLQAANVNLHQITLRLDLQSDLFRAFVMCHVNVSEVTATVQHSVTQSVPKQKKEMGPSTV